MKYSLLILFFISIIKSEEKLMDSVDDLELKNFLTTLYRLDNQVKDLTIQLVNSQKQMEQLKYQQNLQNMQFENKVNEQSITIEKLSLELQESKEEIKLIRISQNELKSNLI